MSEEVFRPYAYSLSLDCTAKGYIQPSLKVQSDETDGLPQLATFLLDRLVKELRNKGYKVATDIEDVPKNGQ